MNMVYNASAGTGKTFQVTRLYERLVLEEGVDPRRILLMTFTDNAAAELRLRVTQRLLQVARDEGGEMPDRARDALARLPSAPIGTIHSYCTRLLREHALEAGLSPGFSTLVGDECDELLGQIAREELLARIDSDPDFQRYCAGVQVLSSPGGFGSSVAETAMQLVREAGSLGLSLEEAESLLPGPEPVDLRPEFAAILKRMRDLPKMTAAAQAVFQCLEQNLPTVGSTGELLRAIDAAGLKKFGRGKGQKPISDDFWKLVERGREAEGYRERYPLALAFARYVQAVAARFRERKHEMDAVDFDDQLRLARDLLASGRAKPEFDYVIVDEVQDTSRIQCDLIQLLWKEGTSLVICGDKKQSIYTWRGADPQVMPDLAAKIEKQLHLQTSFRSKAPIVEVVNRLFAQVYGEEYAPETAFLEPNPDFATPGEKPCVEFLEADDDTPEMEAVANRIRLLVEGSGDWKPAYRYTGKEFRPVDECNAYRYSDILILLRRTSRQPALEQALRHAGIPYTLGGKGSGLFTRQETRDVSLFLNVVTNPRDGLSLVGFLRSPWVGLSDEEIAGLAWSEEGFSFEKLLAQFARADRNVCSTGGAGFPACPETERADGNVRSTSEAGFPACPGTERADRNVCSTGGTGFPACPESERADRNIRSAVELVRRYRARVGTHLASELVRMLIDETGFDALQAGLPRGAQRLANLRKVLDWLREAERGARTTPAAVARKLSEKVANPPPVPEAALPDPEQNAVTIMTVHGSKGLTRRVVFLPDTSFGANHDRSFAHVFLDGDGRPVLGTRIVSPDRDSVVSPGFKEAAERAKGVRGQELKNLFYVAMTRARDLVVTSATVGEKASGWLKELEPFIADGTIERVPYSGLHREAASVPERRVPVAAELAAGVASLPPPPPEPSIRRIPATCLADEQAVEEDAPRRDGGKSVSSALGSLGHAVLEQLALNGWQGSVSQWLEKLRGLFGIDRSSALALEARIERTRDAMRERVADATELLPEYPFVLRDGDRIVDGTIDLLCRIGGGFRVYDYKFTERPPESVADAYRGQMAIYLQAARRAFPGGEGAAVLVVVSEQEVFFVPVE